MAKLITVTRKIELRINTPNKEEKNQYYKTLKSWRDVACNGANMAISMMYCNLKGENITYLNKKLTAITGRPFEFEALEKKIQAKMSKDEDKEIYKEIEAEKREFFESSEVAHYYRLLAAYYQGTGMKTAILSCIANQVASDFSTDKRDYLLHNQSLRTYKRNMPIPFTAQSIRKVHRSRDEEKDREYKDFCFSLFGIPFRTFFGQDRSNNYKLLNEAFSEWFLPDWAFKHEEELSKIIYDLREENKDEGVNVFYMGETTIAIEYIRHGHESHKYRITATIGDKQHIYYMFPKKPVKEAGSTVGKIPGYKIGSNYKLCDSKIQIKEEQFDNGSGGKSERTKLFLLASLQFEEEPWTLDNNKAAYCELDPEIPIKVTIGKKTYNIGSKNDFEYRRIGIQGAYQATQKDLKGTKGGRGRKRKMQGLDRYAQYEKDVVKLKIHQYSRALLKICLENNCKYIYLRIPKKPKDNSTDEAKYLIRNWSYGQFQTTIEWKGMRLGFEISTLEEQE